MNIQSLSVVVPNKKCINNCKFCVAHMHEDTYKNQVNENYPFYDLYDRDFVQRLEFARDNGCNTVMLTGNSEPQQNRGFLAKFGTLNRYLNRPFRWIEMQTTGVLIDERLMRFLRNQVGVSTISLSLSALDDDVNCIYNGTQEKLKVDIKHLCSEIKRYDFNLRLSLNLTDWFENQFVDAKSLLDTCKDEFLADQITFRVLYCSGNNTEQDNWIETHKCGGKFFGDVQGYVKAHGKELEILPFGAVKYSLFDMGIVIDDDCMNKKLKDAYKYLILRPNCKLYSKWDDPASLIF